MYQYRDDIIIVSNFDTALADFDVIEKTVYFAMISKITKIYSIKCVIAQLRYN